MDPPPRGTFSQDAKSKEKKFTKLRDQLNAERRELPMVRPAKNYTFTGADGEKSLLELFDGRRQLIGYHFMLTPGDPHRCTGRCLAADGFGRLESSAGSGTLSASGTRRAGPAFLAGRKRASAPGRTARPVAQQARGRQCPSAGRGSGTPPRPGGSAVGACLEGVEIRVQTARLRQRRVVADLRDPAVLDHDDHVRVADRREAV
ncbi:hypothetical protein RAM_28255 [Amycolatopsis mediterranei S699]|uniref:Uncharacterized protein n=1 Tax=Amycolatopsis mediterranei (strain S699) TaxID=713604 RepID=A0A9R0UAW6_AMYMS|nr:hypothetical protein RAM_28255 [Amycolatopsis mediterranei S699]